MFHIQDNSRSIFIGLMLLGYSSCMISVPLIPEVLDSIENQLPHLKGEELNNVISGYFNSCLGIGEAIGPISAGLLVDSYGVRSSYDIVGTLLLIFTVLFFIVLGNFSLCLPKSCTQE